MKAGALNSQDFEKKTSKEIGKSYFTRIRTKGLMHSESRSLFKYQFVAFFSFWWGLALVGLSYKANGNLTSFSSYLVIAAILLIIGLYSLAWLARAMGERRMVATGVITP
jgi:hypothetical protein